MFVMVLKIIWIQTPQPRRLDSSPWKRGAGDYKLRLRDFVWKRSRWQPSLLR
jgi:hypothetical protein